MAPTVTLTLGAIAPERLKLASGLFNLMRNLGGAIGIAAVRDDPERPHQPALPAHGGASEQHQHRDAGDAGSDSGANATALSGGDAAMGHAIALRQALDADDAGGADADLFGCVPGADAVSGLATVMVPLMRKVAPPKAPVADAHYSVIAL